jgi:UPF0716 protein FxsA
MPLILLLFLFAEIALLIKIGQIIGGSALLLQMLASAALGFLAIRLARRSFVSTREFIALLNRPTTAFRSSGLSLIAGGVLLILPGFLSDATGLFLIVRCLLTRTRPQDPAEPPNGRSDPNTIDVEYRVHDEPDG